MVHLAAIVGDKACKLQADDATEIMDEASRNIYLAAADSGVGHFVFASTCSNYGIMEGVSDPLLNEDAPLRPQSHYARLKVQFEEYLLSQPVMPRTLLRFSTAKRQFCHSGRKTSVGKNLMRQRPRYMPGWWNNRKGCRSGSRPEPRARC